MGGGKETPRQKMIGMMYLVLLALLAMNVSKSVLQAFLNINESLEITNTNFENKNSTTYQSFAAALAKDQEKAKPYYDGAQKVKVLADEMYKYINSIKVMVIRQTDQIPETVPDDSITVAKLVSIDNYDVPSHAMGLADPAKPLDQPLSAVELKRKIKDFEDGLRKILKDPSLSKDIKPEDVEKMGFGLATPDPGMVNGTMETWETMNFYHSPAAAVMCILTKVQSDVRNAEGIAIDKLLVGIGANDFKFDVVVAKVLPKSNYVFSGSNFEADIIVAAYSSTVAPTVTLKAGGGGVTYEEGIAKYKVGASGEGIRKWGGVIKVKKPDGSENEYPFESEYMVAKPAATVSADKMNVLYIGVENPISISASGVALEDLVPNISGGGSLRKIGNGQYEATVTNAGMATISVSAKVDGSIKPMGGMEYRVKRLPDPIAKIGTVEGEGQMSKGMLAIQPGLIASMGDGFAFDLKPIVSSFEMIISGKGIDPIPYESQSYALTPEQKKVLGGVIKGNTVYFQKIKVRMPDGTTRKLSPLSVQVI